MSVNDFPNFGPSRVHEVNRSHKINSDYSPRSNVSASKSVRTVFNALDFVELESGILIHQMLPAEKN